MPDTPRDQAPARHAAPAGHAGPATGAPQIATPQVHEAVRWLAELDDAAPGPAVAVLDQVHRLLQGALDELDEA